MSKMINKMVEQAEVGEKIEAMLEALYFVEWDRFTRTSDGDAAEYNFYGWIQRKDEYKDFVVLSLLNDEDWWWITSSSKRSKQIGKIVDGVDGPDESPCKRVEHYFDIDNAVNENEETEVKEDISLNDGEYKCLEVMTDFADGSFWYFRGIANHVDMNEKEVRRKVRSLSRKGLTEYKQGLFNEDGQVAGSGYRVTEAGRKFIKNSRSQQSLI